MADAEIVIVAEHFRDLLGRADQRGGVAVGAGELGDFGPETFIDAGALLGQRQQPARAGGGMAVSRLAIAGLVLQRGGARQNLLGLGPCLFLGVGEDGADRQAKARRGPSMLRRGDANPRGHIAHLCVRFAPQRKCIGMFARHLDRGIGCTAHEDRNACAVIGLHLRKAVLNPVVFAVIGKRLLAGPFGPDDIEKLVGAGVTLVLVVDGVAVLLQFGGIATGDDMQRHPAAGKLIDGRKLTGDQRRRGEARPLRDQDLEPVGDPQHVLADLLAVRRGGMKGQQRPIEARDLVGLCHRLEVGTVDDGPGPHDGLGRIVVGNEPDEFH